MSRLLGKKTWNKKGTSLVEVIVALTILGIASSVATMSFVSSMQTSNKSKEQIELNSAIDTVKKNVTDALKKPDEPIFGNSEILVIGNTLMDYDDLEIVDGDSRVSSKYKFNVHNESSFSSITPQANQMVIYLITIEKQDGTELRKFRIEVNTLN